MASLVLRPTIISFLDTITRAGGDSLIVLGTAEQILELRKLADDDGKRVFHS